MLDARLNRRPVSRSASVATLLALLAIAIPIGGFVSAQPAFATLAGSLSDPMNAALPGVAIVLTNVHNKAKYEVLSDRTGRYEFVGLAPGDYLLEARLPGFATLQREQTMAGQNVEQELRLQIGSVEETVTVIDNDVPQPANPELQQLVERRRIEREAARCGIGPTAGSPIGGNIRPPMKIKDARPQYPATLRSAGVEGTVVLQGRIGTGGMFDELRVVTASHADFAAAAVEAVRQWQFDSTLLNCVPVETPMRVTVRFQPR
jgi:TonB family protein